MVRLYDEENSYVFTLGVINSFCRKKTMRSWNIADVFDTYQILYLIYIKYIRYVPTFNISR